MCRFRSVMPYIRERQSERELHGPTCVAHEPRGRSWVRKEHSNFGWDWGPVLITCGSYHRFCTEFGFQSFPEPKTTHTFTEPEDRFINSPVMDWHQRGKNGNAKILHYLMSWFPMPHGFDNTLWMSQLVQAMSITYAVEHWRRNMPRCMGAVYWQLNDNLPVASWSSIDYLGNWKALHYAAKRFFAPALLSALEDEERQCIELHLSHDLDDWAPVRIVWQLVTTAGEPIASGREVSQLPRNGSRLAATVDCRDALRRVGPERLLCFAELHRDGQVAGRAWSAFRKPRALRLVAPELEVTSEAHEDKLRLTLRSDRPALFVLIRHNRHTFVADDNAFMLAPAETRQILLRPRGCTVAELSEGLDVGCLTDRVESTY